MSYKKIAPNSPALVAKQRSGLLYWRDPDGPVDELFVPDFYRYMPIEGVRRDLTEATLRQWASKGQLYEYKEPTER